MNSNVQEMMVKQLLDDLNHHKKESEEKDEIIHELMDTIEKQQNIIEILQECEDLDKEELMQRIVQLQSAVQFAESVAGL